MEVTVATTASCLKIRLQNFLSNDRYLAIHRRSGAPMINNTSRPFFSLPVKIQDDSYSSDIAESENGNQITPSPTNIKGDGIKLKTKFLIKKVIYQFRITIYNTK
jgi:hypothetical protein